MINFFFFFWFFSKMVFHFCWFVLIYYFICLYLLRILYAPILSTTLFIYDWWLISMLEASDWVPLLYESVLYSFVNLSKKNYSEPLK